MVALLRRHGKLSAPELARRLEVDRRTVLRDVEALSTAGFGIYAERGRNGGFALLPEYRPDVGGLTAEETRALFLAGGRPVLERLGLAEPLASALTKLSAQLPADRHDQLSRSEQRVLIDTGGWLSGPEELPELDTVQRAVFADRRLRFRYQPMPPSRAGVRTVDPYGLLQAAGTWYLIAAHRGRPRTYRVSRMSEARVLDQPSVRPDDLDLRALWHQLRDRYADERPGIPITLRTTPRWLDLVRRNLAVQLTGPVTVKPDPDDEQRLIVSGTVVTIRGAVGSLAGLGELIEVLEPPELVDGLLDLADHLQRTYRRSGAGRDG